MLLEDRRRQVGQFAAALCLLAASISSADHHTAVESQERMLEFLSSQEFCTLQETETNGRRRLQVLRWTISADGSYVLEKLTVANYVGVSLVDEWKPHEEGRFTIGQGRFSITGEKYFVAYNEDGRNTKSRLFVEPGSDVIHAYRNNDFVGIAENCSKGAVVDTAVRISTSATLNSR